MTNRELLEKRLERRAHAAMAMVYVIAIVSVGFVWILK
jgi:predicted nucleic acid-binding Zn ribbon protein